MYSKKVKFIFIVTLIVTILLSACSTVNEKNNIAEKVKPSQNKDTDKYNKVDNELLKDFINKFIVSIKNDDSKTFKDLVSENGIYSITYFVDGRDQNVVLHLNKEEIRDDLVLANSEKMGITLATMFSVYDVESLESIKINSSMQLSDISFNVDWHTVDENEVKTKLEDIIKTCEDIILINNENIPQVFVLKDNIFAFTQSSAIQEPDVECTGDWVIFEKVGTEYKILAVIQMQ
jgi:hypothetical protein